MLKNLKKRRGSILFIAIVFMSLLQLLSLAFLTLLPVESRAAVRTETQAVGSMAADAGVTEGLAWLRYQLAPPDGSASKEPLAAGVYPSQAQRTRALNSHWSYRWSLEADAQTYPNGNLPIRGYTIVSRAYQDGIARREVRVQVIQDSLNSIAALYDIWNNNIVKPVSSDAPPIGGPVHTNGTMRLWIPEGASFWGSSGEPVFSHGLTASGTFGSSPDGFAYYQGNWYGSDENKRPYNDGGPIPTRYNRMAVDGQDGMKAGSGTKPLPPNTFQLRDAAWGFDATNPIPTTDGVYVNTAGGSVAGGIYIRGEVEEMQLGYGGSEPAVGVVPVGYGDNSWVKIEQPIAGRNSIDDNQHVTVVTVKETPISLPAGSILDGVTLGGAGASIPVGKTLVRNPDGSFNLYDGELNGVVYASEDINNVWGVNKGRRTIAAENEATYDSDGNLQSVVKRSNIRIGGREDDSTGNLSVAAGQKGLIQYGVVDADSDGVLDSPADADNVLGVIGWDVMVHSGLKHGDWSASHPETNPLYIYASVLGGLPGDGGGMGVEAYNSGGEGWVHFFGSRIQAQTRAWGTTSGHGLRKGGVQFDQMAADSPPPYFPALPTFTVKTYEDVPVFDGETL